MAADNFVELNPGVGGQIIAADKVDGKQYQVVKIATGGSGQANEVSTADPMPVNIVGGITVDTTGLATESKQDSEIAYIKEISNTVFESGLTVASDSRGNLVLGKSEGSNLAKPLSVDADGKLNVNANVSIDTTGLATDAKQNDQIGLLFEIRGALNNPLPLMAGVAQEGTLEAILSKIISAPATEAKQDTGNTSLGSIKTNTDKIPAVGQALASASVPVVLPALQITALTPPAAITGFATESTLVAQSAKLPATLGTKTVANSLAVNIASDQTVPMSAVSLPLPTNAATQATLEAVRLLLAATLTNDMTDRAARLLGVLSAGSNIIGKVGIDQTTDGTTNLVRLGAETSKVIGTVNNAAGTNIIGKLGIDQTTPGTTNKVSLGTDTVITKEIRSSSSSVTSPAVTTTSSTALASNTSRVWASFWNEGSATVYIKFGATASITSYTLQLQSGQGYELTNGYTGIIDVITSSGTATLRATELT